MPLPYSIHRVQLISFKGHSSESRSREGEEGLLMGWLRRVLIRELLTVQAGVSLDRLSLVLTKPLRPLWISQNSRIWLNEVQPPEEMDFIPLFLVSASIPNARQRQSHCRFTLFFQLQFGSSSTKPYPGNYPCIAYIRSCNSDLFSVEYAQTCFPLLGQSSLFLHIE